MKNDTVGGKKIPAKSWALVQHLMSKQKKMNCVTVLGLLALNILVCYFWIYFATAISNIPNGKIQLKCSAVGVFINSAASPVITSLNSAANYCTYGGLLIRKSIYAKMLSGASPLLVPIQNESTVAANNKLSRASPVSIGTVSPSSQHTNPQRQEGGKNKQSSLHSRHRKPWRVGGSRDNASNFFLFGPSVQSARI